MPFGLSKPVAGARWLGWRAPAPLGYVIALVLVAAATGFRQWLGDDLAPGVPFITFYPAVLASALIGGGGPGVVAAGTSALVASYLFAPPAGDLTFDRQHVVPVLLFLFNSAIAVGLVAALKGTINRMNSVAKNTLNLVEHLPVGILVVDDAGRISFGNTLLGKLFGVPSPKLLGASVEMLVPDESRSEHAGQRRQFMLHPDPRGMRHGRSVRGRRLDGTEFPVEVHLVPVDDGSRTGVLAMVSDVTERQLAEERRELLTRELHHRTQNLLTIVQSVVSQSLARDRSPVEAREIVLGRLRALSSAFTALRDDGRPGADLREVIDSELKGFSGRATLTCPSLALSAEAAQNFALIVHELATNAVKYGGISTPSGSVGVACAIDDGKGARSLSFEWIERGGPPVAPPEREGFGSAVLRTVTRSMSDRVELDYAPEGLRFRMVAPLERIVPGDAASPE